MERGAQAARGVAEVVGGAVLSQVEPSVLQPLEAAQDEGACRAIDQPAPYAQAALRSRVGTRCSSQITPSLDNSHRP